jgi:endonuclease/exonuclease/phosphatase family metal-dependent hydrolase
VRLVIRTWNLFHGNAVPPEREAFLEEMVQLVSADGPDVVCLQELPVWALGKVGDWSGMRVFGAVARRPTLGPLPSTATLGRALTGLDHGRLRSAFAGQANAILLAPRLRALDEEQVVLNPWSFRHAQARWLGLDLATRLAWAKERRVCQALRVALSDGGTALVANLHATSLHADERVPDAELRRAAAFVESLAHPQEPALICGDVNLEPERSRTLADLRERGWSKPASGIDQVLVRGAPASRPEPWPPDRRRLDGRLLSDHAPVEALVG